MKIQNHLIKYDIICDYIPAVSSVSNLIDLFQKCVVIPLREKLGATNNHYYTHLQQKSFIRCITLLVPVLGNIVVGIIDLHNRKYNDKDFMLKTVKQNGLMLQYASKHLQNDKEIVLAAVNQQGWALQYASEELRNNKEIVLAAIRQDGWALRYVNEELRNDKEIVFVAVNQNRGMLPWVGDKLQRDKDFMKSLNSLK